MDHRRKLEKLENDFKPGLWAWLVTQNDHDECYRIMNSVLGRFYALMMPPERWQGIGLEHPLGSCNLLTDFVPTRWGCDAMLAAINRTPPEVTHDFYIHGDSKDTIKRISEYGRSGLGYIILGNMTGAFAPDKSHESHIIVQDVLDYVKTL